MQVCVKWCFSLECDMSGATAHSIEKNDTLVIVDVQNGFLPGGALAVDDGDAVIPVIN